MIETVMADELKPGDIILIDGEHNGELMIVTVKRVDDEELIATEELTASYSPPNPYSIVRLCADGDRASISILSNKIGFK